MNDMLAEMLRKSLDEARNGERSKPRILPEAAIARLRELLPVYLSDTAPFAPGDLVTPRRDAAVKGGGEPHLVVAVLDGADRHYRFDEGEPGSNIWGRMIDMRVIHLTDDRVNAHWVESADFEPYPEPSRG